MRHLVLFQVFEIESHMCVTGAQLRTICAALVPHMTTFRVWLFFSEKNFATLFYERSGMLSMEIIFILLAQTVL